MAETVQIKKLEDKNKLSKKRNTIPSIISSAFLYWLVLINIFSVALLFFGVPITVINFIVPTCIIVLFLYHKLDKNTYLKWYLLLFLILIVCAICVSGATFDHTWDGAAYHKTAIGLLYKGWNPLYQSGSYFTELSDAIEWPCDNPILWAEVYPKATWYFAAAIYKFTGDIETGKVYTIIAVFIVSGIIYNYLSFKNLKEWQRWIVLIIAGANPIVLAQWQTFYLDGFVSCILIGMIFIFFTILDTDCDVDFKDYQWQMWGLILIGCNLKWSVTLFVVTYCACFSVLYLWRSQKDIINKIRNLGKTFAVGCLAIFILGFSPFVTNFLRYGNLFEGFSNLIGTDNMSATFGIKNLNNAQMFWGSLFGKMSHGEYGSFAELLKIPFTFSKEELAFYFIPDTRIGGFGIFFGGIFLLSMTVTIVSLFRKENRNKKISHSILLFYLVSLVEMMILPATFTARYVCQLYIIPVIAVAILFIESNRKGVLIKSMNFILLFFIVGNLLPWLQCSIENINAACDTRAVFYALSKEDDIDVAFYAYDFSGMHFNLEDYGIDDYEYKEWSELDDSADMTYYNWIKYTD